MKRATRIFRWYYDRYRRFARWYDDKSVGNSFYLPLQIFGSIIPMIAFAFLARIAHAEGWLTQIEAMYAWIGGIAFAWVYLAGWIIAEGRTE